MNARFSTEFDRVQDLVDDVGEELLGDAELRLAAQANDEANFAHRFDGRLDAAVMERYPQYEGFIDEMLNDEVLKGYFFAQIRQQIYTQLRGAERRRAGSCTHRRRVHPRLHPEW